MPAARSLFAWRCPSDGLPDRQSRSSSVVAIGGRQTATAQQANVAGGDFLRLLGGTGRDDTTLRPKTCTLLAAIAEVGRRSAALTEPSGGSARPFEKVRLVTRISRMSG